VTPAAAAHVRSGVTAVDFRASVFPPHGGLSARVYESDLALRLTGAAGKDVVVLGYLGEPAFRISTGGVAVNAASPTAAGMGLLPGPARRAGAPVWQHRSSGRSVVWHDNRLRGLPAGTDRGRWSVPLVVNGRPSRLAGTLWRVPAPAAWPWFVLGIPFIGATALLFLLGERRRFRAAAVAFGIFSAVCAIASAAGFVFDTYSSEGKWVEAGNELAFVVAGVLLVLRGSPDTRAIAGGGLGLLGLAIGLSKLPVLVHGVVLSALPADLARVLVVLGIWAGAAAIAAGLTVFSSVLESAPDPL
jgi:hypothetical protein